MEKKPCCPYCDSTKYRLLIDNRYQCKECFTSFSVTVGTVFHNTHLDIKKWFIAIPLVLNEPTISVRGLSKKINVNKNTSSLIIRKLKYFYSKNDSLIIEIMKHLNEK